jgi:dihydroorotate dehydrogenase electron transfer subunit
LPTTPSAAAVSRAATVGNGRRHLPFRPESRRMTAFTSPERLSTADETAEVVANVVVAEGYRRITARVAGPALSARPGQFFQLECPAVGADRPYFRRPMSTYAVDRAGSTVSFLYKLVGTGTRALAALRPCDRFRLLGPLGNGFTLPAAARRIVVVGRGVGIATLAPFAEHAAGAGVAVTALLSARTAAHLLAADRLAAAGVAVVPLVDSDGSSAPADVAARIARLAEAGAVDALYTCGSARLLALAQRLGRAHGFGGEVALESHMACGLGMCFACVRDFVTPDGALVSRRVCADGPVFPLQEAVP